MKRIENVKTSPTVYIQTTHFSICGFSVRSNCTLGFVDFSSEPFPSKITFATSLEINFIF